MKVLHLSTSDSGGGAALAALRLHQALRNKGTDSSMLVGRRGSTDEHVTAGCTLRRAQFCHRADRQLRRFLRTDNQALNSPAWIGAVSARQVNQIPGDLVHLHWTCSGFLRVESLARFNRPIIWSLHDMWAFCGGEHYADGSERYVEGYRADNRPSGESGLDLNRWIWRRKRETLGRVSNLTVVCVSEWLAGCARKSALLKDRDIRVLTNGVNVAIFRPRSRALARLELGLPAKAQLILFGAVNAMADRRKGFDLLLAALQEYQRAGGKAELVIFGNSPADQQALSQLGFRVHALGEIAEAERLAAVYAACDVMVVPSREEAFGQTAMESLACGTPVVAFRVGGLPEIVSHHFDGYLAPAGDPQGLARGLFWILEGCSEARKADMASMGRAKIEILFSAAFQAEKCRRIYDDVLSATSNRPSRSALGSTDFPEGVVAAESFSARAGENAIPSVHAELLGMGRNGL